MIADPQPDNYDTVHYDTWSTRGGETTGFVAVYTGGGETWVKIVHNGVVICFEQVESVSTNAPTVPTEDAP